MKKLRTTALLLIAVSLCNAFAEKVNFPVKSLVTTSEKSIHLSVDWNEQWFGNKSSTEYNHNLCRTAAILSAVAYVDPTPKSNEIVACYKALGVKENLIDIHYNVDYSNSLWGNDQTAFSFAVKEINSSHGKRNLIFITIRGTPLNANEWISNVNISDRTKNSQEFHEGFLRATKQIESALISFLLKNKIDIDDCFLFITGHSRGAAVANLLSAQLMETDLFNIENIYTYTFASPNVTTNTDINDPKYGFIWNIVNGEDIVPTVPMNSKDWKYRKYGNTKALINSWNTDTEKYEKEYLPRMNEYYKQFLLRDYCPFRTGIFLPAEVTSIATNLNPNVTAFYSGLTDFRKRAETAFWKIFPPKTEDDLPLYADDEPQSPGVIASFATNFAYKQFGVDANYIINCFVDMHAMETYLSWILALDEEEVFSQLGTNILILDGTEDCAVFADDGKCVATILDGKVNFEQIKAPIAASSFLQNHVAIGLPANQTFTVAVCKDSLAPTRIKAKVRQYSASGEFIGETEESKLYPNINKIYVAAFNDSSLTDTNPGFSKLFGKTAKRIKNEGNLKVTSTMRWYGEISASSCGTFTAGVHAGTSKVYASALIGHNAIKIGRSLDLSGGLGTQAILTGRILMDVEILGKMFYAFSDDISEDDDRLNFVPSSRITLSFKPKHKTQLFAGINLDLHIADFNDAAFDDAYRLKLAGQVWTGSALRIVPNFTLGLKF